MRRLLVLRALGLGDLLVVVPALRGLRRRYPTHRLVLAAPAALAPLARATGAVDETLPTTSPDALMWADRPPPDIVVNLHGVGPQSHRALDATRPRHRIGLRAPGWAGPEWADITRAHHHERERWCAVVEAFGVCADPTDLALGVRVGVAGGDVVVHPGAAYGAKRWPADRFALLAARLEGGDHRVVVTGSGQEAPLARHVAHQAGLSADRVLAGRTDIAGLVKVVAGAALVVCGDTGVAHIATALGTPSVVLFGPVPPDRWGPPEGGPHVVLTDAARRRGDPFAEDPDPALLGVDVDEVTHVANALLARRPERPF
jgi:ADP-heptose:LPS heptosyltransferase